MKNIILFGPYGCGKGTQARALAEKYGMEYFETGEQIRWHIKNETKLGKKVKKIVDSGNLISGDDVMEIVRDFYEHLDSSNGYIFDGVPRTFEQQTAFDAFLKEKGIEVERIMLDIPKKMSFERQLKRASESEEKRNDDKEEIMKNRVEVYYNEVKPVIDSYIERGEMQIVDGTKSIEEVTKDISQIIES